MLKRKVLLQYKESVYNESVAQGHGFMASPTKVLVVMPEGRLAELFICLQALGQIPGQHTHRN